MESISFSPKFKKAVAEKNRFLHSPSHLLADELSQLFNDPKHFAFYLKMATLYDHNFLRRLAGEITENKKVKTPGKLFAFLIKKHNQENKQKFSALTSSPNKEK